MATVVAVGTLDTKGPEYEFLRARLLEHGVDVILVDAGIQGEPGTRPDVGRSEVAAAAGADVGRLAAAGDRGAAVETMSRGAAAILEGLHREGRLDAVVGMGGTGGTSLVTYAMQQLPVGSRSSSCPPSPPGTPGRTSARSTSRCCTPSSTSPA